MQITCVGMRNGKSVFPRRFLVYKDPNVSFITKKTVNKFLLITIYSFCLNLFFKNLHPVTLKIVRLNRLLLKYPVLIDKLKRVSKRYSKH